MSVVRANYATFAPSGSVGYFDNISVIVVTPTSEANPGLLRKTNVTSTITETTGSVYFDGTGDYLSVYGSGNDFNFGINDFTIEFWVYLTASDNYHLLIDFRKDASTDGTLCFTSSMKL